MFFRSKPVGSYRYLQIVHSVREGKKVRQQVTATLGRLDLLEASGQLERLMRSGLRHCESFAVLDAHAAGEIDPVAIRRIGPDLVFARLWKESGISDVLRSLLRERQYEFDVERAIYLPFCTVCLPAAVIGQLNVGRKIISSLELKVLNYITFTGRWRFWVRQSRSSRSRPGRFAAPKTSWKRRSSIADGIYLLKWS